MSADGLTDEQSLREMIQTLAQMRQESRALPRFPAPAFLAGRTEGFDGFLVFEEGDPLGDLDEGSPIEEDRGDRLLGVRIVDFSEAGLQLELHCEDPWRLFRNRLALEIQGVRVPIMPRWCRQSPPRSRAGVLFAKGALERADIMHLIARLGEDLAGFLVKGLREGPIPFTRQAGSFAYLAIYYALRLRFLKALASVADLAAGEGPLIRELASSLESSGLNPDKADPLLKLFMKPIEDFGCALLGIGEDCLLLESDARSLLTQTLLPIQGDVEGVHRVLPALRFLHHSFMDLKALMPDAFWNPRFELPFFRYSARIARLESLRDQVAFTLWRAKDEGRALLP